MSGGDSGHLGPIPSRGRKKAAVRTLGHARRRSGWHGTARGGDGRGAELGYWEEDGEEEERQGEGEIREKRGRAASRGCSRGSFSTSERQAGGGTLAAMRRTRRCCLLEEEGGFCRKPPRVWKIPGKKIKTAHFCKIWHFKWCAKILKFGRAFLEK
jgi:hypothetical protein